jgi:hypothetical protein
VSHKGDDGIFYIVPEPVGRCELCGAVEETRPYGPNREQICFDCGEKDPDTTKRRFLERIDGPAD